MTSIDLKFDEFMNPLLTALRVLGGSGTNDEINEKVAEIAQIPQEQLEVLHNPKKGGITEIEYRLMWTRSYLKAYGLLENSARGVWALTEKGSKTDQVDEKEVVKIVRDMSRGNKKKTEKDEIDTEDELAWQEELLEVVQSMQPAAFERLIQRLLRESGFSQVEVTGKSGDGGIDGKGILRLGGFLSFHVLFQAKKWQGVVGAGQVRDFRGAMVGRADKGLLITTGTFTKDAVREATRDGATPIDLIDGDQLVQKLKELSLGVKTTIVRMEQIDIDKSWFLSL